MDEAPKSFLSAEWRNLVMINFEVDPTVLRPFVPAGTEADSWNGHHFLSLIGFQFLNTKLRGIGIPFHKNFEEVNLRFYVKRKKTSGWVRGVVFIREWVPKPAIAWVANTFYHEKYASVPMRSSVHGRKGLTSIYEWKNPSGTSAATKAWNRIRFYTEGEAKLPEPGSVEEFISEHYWGYNRINENSTTEYGVEHEPWKIYGCNDFELICDFASLYGKTFSFLSERKPSSVFMADGSPVIVRKGTRIRT